MEHVARLSLSLSVSSSGDRHSDVTGDGHSDGNVVTKQEFRSRLRESLIIIIAYSTQGFAGALTGPTLQDLRFLTNSSTEEISQVITAEFIGHLVGSLVATYAYIKISRSLLFCLCLMVCTATLAAIPWCPNVGVMSAVFAIRGISSGLLITGLNLAIVWIWGTENGPYLQALHLSLALGSLAAPLLANPFLTVTGTQPMPNLNYSEMHYMTTNLSSNIPITTMQNWTGGTETVAKQSRVYIVYTIIAGWCFIWAVIFLIQVVQSGKVAVTSTRRDEQPVQLQVESHTARFYINRIGLIAFGFIYGSVLNSFPNYLSSFVMEYLNWTSSMGAILTSVFWASLCIGRAVSVLTAKYISPTVTVMSCLLLSSVVLVLFTLLNQLENGIMWASITVIGISMGPVGPAVFSWYVQETSSLTSIITGATIASAGLGSALTPLLLGYLFDNVTPLWFCYLLTGGNIMTLVLAGFLIVANHILRNKHYAYSSLPGKVYN